MKNKYNKPFINVIEMSIDDVICMSGFQTLDENNIFQDVDVTID